MKKVAFPVCSQNLPRLDEYDVHKSTNPKFMIIFAFVAWQKFAISIVCQLTDLVYRSA